SAQARGSTCVKSPGKAATTMSSRITVPASQNIQRPRRSRQASSQRLLLRSLTRTASTAPRPASTSAATKRGARRRGVLLDIADPRVEHAIEQVDQQVDEHVDDDEHGDDGDDLGTIVATDGFEKLIADAGHVEDALGDGGTDDQDAEVGRQIG